MYYPSSENKGADQLRGYREADLRLCFRLCRLLVFPWGGSNIGLELLMKEIIKHQILTKFDIQQLANKTLSLIRLIKDTKEFNK